MPLNWRRKAATQTESSTGDAPDAEASATTSQNPRAKLDKTGLYDLAQVKRLLDDEMIEVSHRNLDTFSAAR